MEVERRGSEAKGFVLQGVVLGSGFMDSHYEGKWGWKKRKKERKEKKEKK